MLAGILYHMSKVEEIPLIPSHQRARIYIYIFFIFLLIYSFIYLKRNWENNIQYMSYQYRHSHLMFAMETVGDRSTWGEGWFNLCRRPNLLKALGLYWICTVKLEANGHRKLTRDWPRWSGRHRVNSEPHDDLVLMLMAVMLSTNVLAPPQYHLKFFFKLLSL